MTPGELPGWEPGTAGRPTDPDPYAGSYVGPWSGWSGDPMSDDQLRRLPPPVPGAPPPSSLPTGQRPAVVGLAVTLAVTASLLWVCGLSLFVLVSMAGVRAMQPAGDDGVVFHVLDEFLLRMGDGLWLPLYGFPLASLVTAFLLLNRRPWSRIAHSAVGALSLGWAAWWLRDSLLSWAVVALYVGAAVAVLWVPSVGRWYAGRVRRPRPAAPGFSG